MSVHTAGYYRSEGTPYEDAMASLTIRGVIYKYLQCYPDGTFIMVYSEQADLHLPTYLNSLSAAQKQGQDHGTYTLEEEHSIRFDVWFREPAVTHSFYLTILNDVHLTDENGQFFAYIDNH